MSTADTPNVTRKDEQNVKRAIAAIDRIAERQGDNWDAHEFDQLSRARAEMVEWIESHRGR